MTNTYALSATRASSRRMKNAVATDACMTLWANNLIGQARLG